MSRAPHSSRARAALAIVCVALTTAVAQAGNARGPQVIGFASSPLRVPWQDGACYGPWCAVYHGYGTVRVVGGDGTRVISLAPRAAASTRETYAALVRTQRTWNDLDFTVRVDTRAQLRIGGANPWEVGWVLWHYTDNRHFYYFIAKPNGWELGKEDPAYPGSQRYLPNSHSPTFPIGRSYLIRVRVVAATITVWVAGKRIVTYTDRERPYRSGSIGLYTEDASAVFSPITVRGL
jgi:3-keto-disaccharide hydrolase